MVVSTGFSRQREGFPHSVAVLGAPWENRNIRCKWARIMKWPVAVLSLLVASPALAQTGFRSPQGWSLGIRAGGSAFTDFQRTDVEGARFSTAGLVEARAFSRRVGAQTATSLAGSLSYWPNRNWGLRLNAIYSPSRFETIIPESAAQFMGEPRSSSDSARLAPLTIMSYQAQAVFRMPTIHNRVMPYGLIGGGVLRYSPHSGDQPAETGKTFQSGPLLRAAASFALGAQLPMRRQGWGLNFELMDQMSRTPVTGGPVKMFNALSFTVGATVMLHQK